MRSVGREVHVDLSGVPRKAGAHAGTKALIVDRSIRYCDGVGDGAGFLGWFAGDGVRSARGWVDLVWRDGGSLRF